MAKLSEKLLNDLGKLDGEKLTAKTQVEIECIEDITDIVKTYLLGQPFKENMTTYSPNNFNLKKLNDVLPIQKISKSYVDKLEKNTVEKTQNLSYQDIHILQEGQTFIDEKQIKIKKRQESDTESVDSILAIQKSKFESNVFINCDLHRTNDHSSIEVLIAQQRNKSLTFFLQIKKQRLHKLKNSDSTTYEIKQNGCNFYNKTTHKIFNKKYESDKNKKQLLSKIATKEPNYLQNNYQNDLQLLNIKKSNKKVVEKEIIDSQFLNDSKKIKRPKRKFSFESSSSTDNQLQPSFYNLQTMGQYLEQKSIFRKIKKYDSETSTDYEKNSKSGITHVILKKKEAHSNFEVAIECENIEILKSEKLKELPEQKYENLEYTKTIQHNKTHVPIIYYVEKTLHIANKFKNYFNILEFSQKELNQIVHIKRKDKNQDILSTSCIIIESLRYKTNEHKLREYSIKNENFNILMKSCGTIEEKTSTDWSESITGNNCINKKKLFLFF